MASYDAGKAEVCAWIRKNFSIDAEILDVGACDGKWRKLLFEYSNIDACEIFDQNAHNIEQLYRHTFNCDILDLEYEHYDLIIFGDVLEHMSVEKAQAVLEYAKSRCTDLIIGVPWLYEQGPLYGNEWERHIQPDLTPQLFNKRYPGYAILHDCPDFYCYYHKKKARKKNVSK